MLPVLVIHVTFFSQEIFVFARILFLGLMASDLLELAASYRCSGDLSWLSGDAVSK